MAFHYGPVSSLSGKPGSSSQRVVPPQSAHRPRQLQDPPPSHPTPRSQMLNALCPPPPPPIGPWCFQKDLEDTMERMCFSHPNVICRKPICLVFSSQYGVGGL